jgi:hypothetical protein
MNEAGEEDGIRPETVPTAVDERELARLEIDPPQRLVSKPSAQDAVTWESIGREDDRPTLPSELARVLAPAATPRGQERRHD